MTLLPSDDLYSEWNWLLTVRAAWINAGCHYDLAQTPAAERRAMVDLLDDELWKAFGELSR